MVIIRLHGVLKEELGIKELEVGDGNLIKILDELPEKVKKVLEKYSQYLLILVNGKRIYDLSNTFVSHVDIVDITLPIGGG
ncbi:MAG: hypothetical protein QXO98_00750 [Sulfolobales archaeon]